MFPHLQTTFLTGGFCGRNEWLSFEEDLGLLRKLRERVEPELGALPADGWELLLALRHYVHMKLPHDGWKNADRRDAFTLLDLAEAGGALRCVEHGTLLSQIYQAFGIPARILSIRAPEPGLGLGKGHVLCEVWYDAGNKWVVMDSQMDAHWEAGGRVLSALEVHNLVVSGRTSELRWVFAETVPAQELPNAGQVQQWARYFTYVGYTRNGACLTHPVPAKDQPGFQYLDYRVPPCFQFQGGPAPTFLEPDQSLVWFDCNRVRIDVLGVKYGEDQITLELGLRHCTPWFERYAIKATGSVEEHDDGRVTWTLTEGEHTFVVSTVNAMGRRGAETALGLLCFLPETVKRAFEM